MKDAEGPLLMRRCWSVEDTHGVAAHVEIESKI
jgi:hypothetical protein